MATIESRIEALESTSAAQGEKDYFVVICKGSEPTPEQEAEVEQHERVLLVTFH